MTNESVVEEWRPVKGFEGCYEASSRGRIKSVSRRVQSKRIGTKKVRERILKTHPTKGYPAVKLSVEGRTVTKTVHRLVMTAFCGPAPNEKHQVNHLDGDKTNNRIDNLEWVSAKENCEHACQHGLMLCGERHSSSKLSDSIVRDVMKYHEESLSHKAIGGKLGINGKSVSAIINGDTWTSVTGIVKKPVRPNFAGENNPSSKITSETAAVIRQESNRGDSVSLIMRRHGVTRGIVGGIKSGKTWNTSQTLS